MTDVALIVPVLGRPHRVAPLLASLEAASSPVSVAVSTTFVVSPRDDAEVDAIRAAGGEWLLYPNEPGPGDFARKVNYAVDYWLGEERGPDWFFLGADDLEFTGGWIAEALVEHFRSGACVVGTNDDANPRTRAGHSSTHTLVYSGYARECGTIDETGRLLCELYDHNFVDDELVGTATLRETYSHARASIVRHLHPNFNQTVERDATYEKGQARFSEDRTLYQSRKTLWAPPR